jgi:hypothetical protein
MTRPRTPILGATFSLAAFFALFPVNVSGSPDWSIAGLTLGSPIKSVGPKLLAMHPTARIESSSSTMTQTDNVDPTLQYTTPALGMKVEVLTFPDSFTVVSDIPQAKHIVAINRRLLLDSKSAPPLSEMKRSLIQKYGAPTLTRTEPSTNTTELIEMSWSDARFRMLDDEGRQACELFVSSILADGTYNLDKDLGCGVFLVAHVQATINGAGDYVTSSVDLTLADYTALRGSYRYLDHLAEIGLTKLRAKRMTNTPPPL